MDEQAAVPGELQRSRAWKETEQYAIYQEAAELREAAQHAYLQLFADVEVAETERRCTQCDQVLPLEQFSKARARRNKDGIIQQYYRAVCKECNRQNRRRRDMEQAKILAYIHVKGIKAKAKAVHY
jgi:uridine phosphorylase